jgi:hypothetical protein
LEPNGQSNRLYSGGCNEEKRYEELRGDEIFLIGLGSVVEVNINPGSFSRWAEDLSIVKSHDDSISADQLSAKAYPLFNNIPTVKRAIFDRFVVTGPLISARDSKECVSNMTGRRDESTQEKLKECRSKS